MMKTFTLARLKRYSIATAVYAVLLVMLVALSGCDIPMANEDIIAEVAKCEEANYFPKLIRSDWDSRIVGVECTPIFDENGKRIKQ